MAISGDYARPVQVNGFTCKNCTDVDYAKKHIDPAHPKSGPYGVDAAADPTQTPKTSAGAASAADASKVKAACAPGVGTCLDISA